MKTQMILSTERGTGGHQLAFVIHPDVSSLPQRPGIFALLGKGLVDRDRPLYFGYADRSMLDQVPYDAGFAQAIRHGPFGFASAYLPSGEDPQALIAALAAAYDAPINAAATALAEIDEARQNLQAQAVARRMAAQ